MKRINKACLVVPYTCKIQVLPQILSREAILVSLNAILTLKVRKFANYTENFTWTWPLVTNYCPVAIKSKFHSLETKIRILFVCPAGKKHQFKVVGARFWIPTFRLKESYHSTKMNEFRRAGIDLLLTMHEESILTIKEDSLNYSNTLFTRSSFPSLIYCMMVKETAFKGNFSEYMNNF